MQACRSPPTDTPAKDQAFRYYFGQREAIETLVWPVEIAGQGDTKALIEAYTQVFNVQ